MGSFFILYEYTIHRPEVVLPLTINCRMSSGSEDRHDILIGNNVVQPNFLCVW